MQPEDRCAWSSEDVMALIDEFNVMEPIADFSVIPLDNDHSRLLYRGNVVKERIAGIDIDLQLKTRVGYVLFVTEDCPFEETLHIYYLDASLKLQDRTSVWRLYCPGIVRNVQWTENEITFSFLSLEP